MGTVKYMKLQKYLLFAALFTGSFLHAQNELASESGSFVVNTDEGFRVFQYFSFPAVPDALYYEIEIEELASVGAVPVETITSQTNRIELSLRAGSYRYRITAYNRMGLLEGRSAWQEFNVQPAIMPTVEAYQPFYGLFYELADSTGSITVFGQDFSAESEFALVAHDRNFDWTGVTLEERRGIIVPDQVIVTGNQAQLTFRRQILKRGYYDIFVRNPGGLWTTLGQVRVGYRKNTDFTVSFGYSPTFALFDIENATQGSDPILDRFNPAGSYMRLGYIPVKTRFGNFGIEIQFNYILDKRVQGIRDNDPESYSALIDPLQFVTINILYQFIHTERLQHNIRLGLWPIGVKYHMEEDIFGLVDPPGNFWYFNLGYSAQYFIWKNVYAEAGIDFILARNFEINHNHFMIRPGIGLGWQFGRWAEHAEVAEGARRGEDYSVPVTDMPKPEFQLSIGWAPMIPLAGIDRYGRRNGIEDVYIDYFNPLGMNIRFVYLPYRWSGNKLGFGIDFAILDHKNRTTVDTSMPDILYTIDLLSHLLFGVYYQRQISEDWIIGLNAGIGISNSYDYNYNPRGRVPFAFNTGASVQYFFWRDAYVEAGFNFVFILDNNATKSLMRPGISIGWQFNRNNETGLRLPGNGLPEFLPSFSQTE